MPCSAPRQTPTPPSATVLSAFGAKHNILYVRNTKEAQHLVLLPRKLTEPFGSHNGFGRRWKDSVLESRRPPHLRLRCHGGLGSIARPDHSREAQSPALAGLSPCHGDWSEPLQPEPRVSSVAGGRHPLAKVRSNRRERL